MINMQYFFTCFVKTLIISVLIITPLIIFAQNNCQDIDSIGIQRLIEKGYPAPNVFKPLQKQAKPTNIDDFHRNLKTPQKAIDTGILDGHFHFAILVNEKGEYVAHYFKSQVHPLWKEELNKHICALKFEPAIDKEGKAVVMWVNVPLWMCFK